MLQDSRIDGVIAYAWNLVGCVLSMHHTYRPHERTGMSMQASSVHACGDAVSNVGMASEVTLLASL